ncbi:hypothetical protein BGW38_003532 [Lunasporangiospora selenospora]|uniref:Transmembrane protein n=1 Tax=Lunasporangiospora selenospora TaxID=979761 RepID=A0A9P6FQH4_9FUNG|nr:hypothetical protein BGW38_003532 [Lunasporangiospora selenospora]
MDPFDDLSPRAHYQPDVSESLSLFLSLSCISVMSLLFGRKTSGTTWSTINYARGLVIALYILSWAFSIMAAMLVQTNNMNLLSCQLSIWTCIFLYASSKVVIYLFLVERVHVVTAIGVTRWNSRTYKFNLAFLSPYLAIMILAIVFRVATITPEGHCNIGLLKPAAVPFIVYDILASTWLTGLFVHALLSSTSMLQGPTKSKLRDVARRTLVGSVFALVLSCANISTLVYFSGQERGLFCLASCTLDVTLNAITIHWVTSRAGGKNKDSRDSSDVDRVVVPRNHRIGFQPSPQQPDHYAMQGLSMEKQFSPLQSHISVTVESYVEEYHQMQYGKRSTTDY